MEVEQNVVPETQQTKKRPKERKGAGSKSNEEGCCTENGVSHSVILTENIEKLSIEAQQHDDTTTPQMNGVEKHNSKDDDDDTPTTTTPDERATEEQTPLEKPKIEYKEYESELQMPDIMQLIQNDLSEPYSIYTYRYFIHNWPKLCFLAMHGSKCVGAIVCKLDVHKMVRRGYIAMLAVDKDYRKLKIGTTLVQKAIEVSFLSLSALFYLKNFVLGNFT